MQIPRVQFTIRRIMIVVAIFAILFAFIYLETVGSFYGPGVNGTENTPKPSVFGNPSTLDSPIQQIHPPAHLNSAIFIL